MLYLKQNCYIKEGDRSKGEKKMPPKRIYQHHKYKIAPFRMGQLPLKYKHLLVKHELRMSYNLPTDKFSN